MSALTSPRVVTSMSLWVSRQPIAIDDKAPGVILEDVNYNNVSLLSVNHYFIAR